MGHLTHYGLIRYVKCAEGPNKVTLTTLPIHHSDTSNVVDEVQINQSRTSRVHVSVTVPTCTQTTELTLHSVLRC